jgi:ribonuclease J
LHTSWHKEIGGTCIELEAQDQRLVLDVGLPLNVSASDEVPLPPVSGFATPDPTLLGVLISHPHVDHYGLAYRLPQRTMFLIGKAAQSILAAADIFTPARIIFQNVMFLEDQKPIALGPFVITSFLVDHSAYDAYAILVEADGKRIFYSGDFRAHGRKRQLLERLIQHPPERVDVLLMEGTTISRVVRDFPYRSRPGRTVRRSLSPDHWNASRLVLGPEHRQACDNCAGVHQNRPAVHH